jgi:FtsP/CotA-like multicopper oxidase with cupredoxin domain
MANISKRNRKLEKENYEAQKNRREIIAAQLSRREMMKMGLLTSAGLLVATKGLSARARNSAGHFISGGGGGGVLPNTPPSPPTSAFTQPFTRFQVKQPVAALNPAPTIAPNTGAGEGRTIAHQAFTQFPPQKFYEITQSQGSINVHPDLPLQPMWCFDGQVPGPLYIARYGEPILVRNHNNLPANNGGFGKNQVTTHLHNGHTPSESDGFPCYFWNSGQFYDQHYPNVYAGVNSTHIAQGGDINEAMSTLWYHDHMLDFTSQNVYKGLMGMYNLYNEFDTGDESTGFHLPSFGDGVSDDSNFDVNMVFSDIVFDQHTGLQVMDTFNFDGVLGDKFLVNGKIDPVMHVHPRRYRFRWLDTGPSRFYQFFLTDLTNLNAHNYFYQISVDGNLMPNPVKVESVRLGVAERADVIIDFSQYAGKTLYIENRLEQTDGRGPTGNVLGPNQGHKTLKIIVDLPPIEDHSVDPATNPHFYDLPEKTAPPRIIRNFNFERNNGMWAINGKFMDCDEARVQVTLNSIEQWNINNNSGGWQHPVHIHFEEFQFLSINGQTPTNTPLVQVGRRDVIRLEHNMQAKCRWRFRDFIGKYPMHCHNVVHEDHAMMLVWEIMPPGVPGNNSTNP